MILLTLFDLIPRRCAMAFPTNRPLWHSTLFRKSWPLGLRTELYDCILYAVQWKVDCVCLFQVRGDPISKYLDFFTSCFLSDRLSLVRVGIVFIVVTNPELY